MTSSSPRVATTSANRTPPPARWWVDIVTADRPNIRFAAIAPTTPPTNCADDQDQRVAVLIAPSARSTRVTMGLNAADTGCSAMIRATSTAPVTTLFSSSCSPTSFGESRTAAMPEPMTAATRNAVPMASAAGLAGQLRVHWQPQVPAGVAGPCRSTTPWPTARSRSPAGSESQHAARLGRVHDRPVHALGHLVGVGHGRVGEAGRGEAVEVFGLGQGAGDAADVGAALGPHLRATGHRRRRHRRRRSARRASGPGTSRPARWPCRWTG